MNGEKGVREGWEAVRGPREPSVWILAPLDEGAADVGKTGRAVQGFGKRKPRVDVLQEGRGHVGNVQKSVGGVLARGDEGEKVR